MPRINRPEDTIYEVQRFLYELGLRYEWLPTVSADGIYGENTKEAVRQFQRRFELPVTGLVDYDTWQLLYAQFDETRRLRTDTPSPSLTPGTLPLKIGSRGYGLVWLNSALMELSSYYPSLPPLAPTSIYQFSTATAVRALERVYQREETGEVDVVLWNAIFSDLASKQRANDILQRRKMPSAFLALPK